jgi:hypothetical protein
MRWPFRRPRDASSLTPDAPVPGRTAGETPAPARATGSDAVATAAADRRAASTPRSDWARLAPLGATLETRPPLTFYGDQFGRSVAGARTMAASMRHRPSQPGRAPSGVLLDAVTIEAVEPLEARHEPEIPAVSAPEVNAAPVHRKVVDTGKPPATDLLTSDASVAFPPAPDREREPSPFTTISWTAESGFVESTPKSPMRLVGQRGELDSGDPAAEEPPADDAEPGLRYLPAPGPRRQQPPPDVVELVRQQTGVHVGDAVIDRSPEVTERASQMGAIAFTERGTVHLPSELGEITDASNRAIVAHELTHVAQQRALGPVPSEDSPEGRDLEAEARRVQRLAAGDPIVRPHFLRRRTATPDRFAGVQRLAGDDNDPYAWQERDPERMPSAERDEFEALGMFGGYSIREGSRLDRARGGAVDYEAADESWAREYEQTNSTRLQAERDRRHAELIEEANRERRIEALREGEDEPEELTRADLINLRRRLDEEMPWQFGPPPGVDPYNDNLPPPTDEEREAEERARRRRARSGGSSSTRTARTTSSGGRRSTGSSPLIASRPGGGRGPGAGRGAGGSSAENRFDWQEREPTEQQEIEMLFGGGLFGALLGLAAGEETDDDRRRVEIEALPRLVGQRQDKERELRHVTLRSKLTQTMQEASTPVREPIQLTREEIVEIRRQVDQEMPLEFALPDYLEMTEDAQIRPDGTISDTQTAPEAAPEATPPGTPPTTTPGTPPTTAAATAAAATAAGAVPPPTDAPPPPPPTDAPPPLPTSDVPPPTDAPPPPPDAEVAAGTAAAGGTSLIGAGLAGLAGGVVGAGLASAFEPDGDSFAHDEEAAHRILTAASDLDIDALSRRIWTRIRREMRTELIVDRERAGSLADVR